MTKAPWSDQKAARRLRDPDAEWAAEIRERVLADCHEAGQRDAVDFAGRFFTLCVGRGGGKTTVFKGRYVIEMAAITNGRFIYGAPTREMATDLLWDPMKETCEKLGIEADFQEVKRICTFRRTGARLKLVGLDDKREMGKQRGQPFNGVGVDEICEFPPELIEWFVDRIVGPRLGERAGWLGLGSTPGTQLRGMFYEATRQGSKLHVPFRELAASPGWDGWVSFAWSLKEIAALADAARRYPAIIANWLAALATKDRNRWGDDNPVWLREYMGRWVLDNTMFVFRYLPHKDGKPWNQWDPPKRGPMQIAVLPDTFSEWLFVVTMDEGFSDPFACNAFAFSPQDVERCIYHVYGMEQGRRRNADGKADERPPEQQQKMYARAVAVLLIGEALDAANPAGLIGELGDWPVGMEGDCSEAMILELANVYGVRVERFDRTTKYKAAQIEIVNGDFTDGRMFILAGSVLEAQLQDLQWVEDSYGNLVENKAQANHGSDTLVIARRVIGKLISTGTVTVPEPDGKGGGGSAAPAVKRAAAPPTDRDKVREDPELPEDRVSHSGGFGGMLVGDYGDPWGNL